jgi:hypothetical protein
MSQTDEATDIEGSYVVRDGVVMLPMMGDEIDVAKIDKQLADKSLKAKKVAELEYLKQIAENPRFMRQEKGEPTNADEALDDLHQLWRENNYRAHNSGVAAMLHKACEEYVRSWGMPKKAAKEAERMRVAMKEIEEVKPQDEAREREAFEYVKRLNPTWKPLEPVFTPDAVAVAMKVMERAGWAAGEKFELDLRIKADRTNQSYYVEDGGGKRVYWIDGYRDLDKMIDQIVAVMKLRRGDSDTVLPSRWFKIKGVDPIMRPSGKYRVHYATSTRGLNTSEKDFATKQEAEAFAKAKTDKGLWNNVFELQEYSGECKSYKTR